ncbi:MAG: CPBP family intramembrane metalloprotease [Mediterranea sp.]|jgi:membrane protease YdiL (CAAX protease family)|nr:CPBP family intramembrane metalloprotease [Mediterranea sp.]
MNSVETLTDKGRTKLRLPAWAGIPLFFILFVGFLMLATVPIKLVHDDMWIEFFAMAAQVVVIALASFILCRIEGRPMSDLGFSFRGRMKDVAWGLAFAVVIYGIALGFGLGVGTIELTGFRFDASELLFLFLFYILVAVGEEMMFRGYILSRLLHTRMNRFAALFLTSALFAALHLFNPGISVLSFVNLVLAGLLLGASYLYTHNLAFPISLHLFWNWLQGPVLGYEVSGQEFGQSMLTQRLPVENVWNGGAFGFEGSIPCTLLVLAGIALIICWGERRERQRAVTAEPPQPYSS